MSLHVIILAAGKGSRMKSDIPKVLHKVAGMPMLHRVLSTAKLLAPEQIHLVLGHGIQAIQDTLANQWSAANIVRQAEQLGTGHAVNIALDHVPDDGISLFWRRSHRGHTGSHRTRTFLLLLHDSHQSAFLVSRDPSHAG